MRREYRMELNVTRWRIVGALLAIVLLTACSVHVADGSGSEVTNGFTFIAVTSTGDTVNSVSYTLRPESWKPLNNTVDTTSDSLRNGTTREGFAGCEGFRSGEYRIHIVDTYSGATAVVEKLFQNEQADLGEVVLRAPGTVSGTVYRQNLSDSVSVVAQIPGTDLIVPVVDGAYTIPNCPVGEHGIALSVVTGKIEDTVLPIVSVDESEIVILDEVAFTMALFSEGDWKYRGKTEIYAEGIVPLRLGTGFPFEQASSNGADLRIFSSSGDAVPFVISNWNSSEAVVTVRLDSFQDSLTLLWGNEQTISVSEPNDVFDTTWGYRGYWAFENFGKWLYRDMTVFENDIDVMSLDSTEKPEVIPGILGDALQFDGMNDYLVIRNSESLEMGEMFTLSFWAKVDSDAAVNGRVFSKEYDFEVKENHGKLQFSSGGAFALCSTPFPQGEWFMGTVTVNRAGETPIVKIFINGVEQLFESNNFNSNYSDGNSISGEPLYIGALGTVNGEESHFLGSLDEMKVIDRLLTQQEVVSLYEREKPSPPIKIDTALGQ